MIDERLRAAFVQEAGDFLHSTACSGVNDAAAFLLGIQDFAQHLALCRLPFDSNDTVREVLTVKPGDKPLHRRTAQLLHNIVLHLNSSGRGQGKYLWLLEILNSLAQA